ncbi:hypothetical protein AND_008836 [Anopheles darlingi]|uniref:Gustatory receptor n=1 Tax=Anopheles darlingi TaxID=43151 RepID=W5J9Y8_ANODA|nr:hypothetical protein AND_008836 [Anopheles darlingi]
MSLSSQIAATIVTYELVLTQVNEAEAKNGDDNPCTLHMDELVGSVGCRNGKFSNKSKNLDEKPLIVSRWKEWWLRCSIESWFRWPKPLRKAEREDWMHDGTFHEAVRGILTLAQLFSIMPVCGILSKDPRKLRLSYTSIRAFYAYFCALGILFLTTMSVFFFASKRYHFQKMVTAFFYCYNLYGMYRFWKLAKSWPGLMVKWTQVDDCLPAQRNEYDRTILVQRIKVCSILVMMLSLSEHLLSIVAAKMTEKFWGEQRQRYRNVCDLVNTVDDHVSVITMLSISNNLFFICVQILNSLK